MSKRRDVIHAIPRPAPAIAIGLVAWTAVMFAGSVAFAQQPAPSAPSAQQFQPAGEWQKLPKMVLERQFAGPLQDTVMQRWRDPIDGTVCYIYLPISAPHSPPTASGFVQYGANTIGSISCTPAAPAAVRRR